MHVLLTRPYLQSVEMKRQLEEIGCRVSIEPVLEISPVQYSPEIYKNSKAFAVTSLHASSEVARQNGIDKSIPVYAVGSATAKPLREAGFKHVFEANGNAKSLLTFIREQHKPEDGMITYLSGWHITQDLARVLAMEGYKAQRVVSYKANPVKNTSPATKSMIRHNDIDMVILMSYRTGYNFSTLCNQAHIGRSLQKMTAAVLSEHVASSLNKVKWKKVCTAEEPSKKALIEMIKIKSFL